MNILGRLACLLGRHQLLHLSVKTENTDWERDFFCHRPNCPRSMNKRYGFPSPYVFGPLKYDKNILGWSIPPKEE